MTCYHPLRGFQIGLTDKGKKNLKVVSSDVDYIFRKQNDPDAKWSCGSFYDKEFDHFSNSADIDNYRNSFIRSQRQLGYKIVADHIEIPCGRCIGCRLKKSKDWAVRCVLESKSYKQNCFITLTYNDENLPCAQPIVNVETGDIFDSPIHSLNKKDFQDFFKRLRRYLEYHNYSSGTTIFDDISGYEKDVLFRYFGCGEYGPTTMRPHGHFILFGFRPDDLIVHSYNHLGQPVYRSPLLEKLWGKGFVSVGELTFESAAYVARYVTKKLYGDDSSIYDELNYVPEFSMMSLRPGIAYQYYQDHSQFIYESDKIYISRGLEKAMSAHPP